LSKERDYFRAVRRAAASVNSNIPLKEKLDAVIHATALAARAGASLILLDATEPNSSTAPQPVCRISSFRRV